MKNTPGGPYYTAKEAQAKLGLSKAKFHKWVRQGLIPRVILPGMKQGVYPKRDIEALALSMSAQQKDLVFSPSSPADLVEELNIANKYRRYGFRFSLSECIALQQRSRFCYYSLKLRGTVIGYGSIFSLPQQILDDLLSGKKVEQDITPDSVLSFPRLEPFDVYMDTLAIDPELPRHLAHYYSGVLIYCFIDLLYHWLANDYQITAVYVVAHSELDEKLLKKLGFQNIEEKSLAMNRKPYRYLMDASGKERLHRFEESYWHHLRVLF